MHLVSFEKLKMRAPKLLFTDVTASFNRTGTLTEKEAT